MNLWILRFFKILPILTFIFILLVLYILLIIDDTASYWFMIFILAEIYVNWIAVYLATTAQNNVYHEFNTDTRVVINLNLTPSLDNSSSQRSHKQQNYNTSNVDTRKIWYCPKCLTYSPLCHHCPLCNKCVIFRDHHCFFLGTCICKQNMSNFIVFCLYISVASLYADFCLFSYLCKQFSIEEENVSFWYLLVQCFFPIALSRWLLGESNLVVLSLVSLFDILVSTGILTFSFGLYSLFFASPGKSKTVSASRHNSNFSNIFGKWGLLNFLFPVTLGKKILRQRDLQTDYKCY